MAGIRPMRIDVPSDSQCDFEIVGFCRSGEGALDTAEEILRRWSDARVLMVSSFAYNDTIERAKSFGEKGFLVKHFHEEALAGALTDALKDGE